MNIYEQIKKGAADLSEEVIQLRRIIHGYAEIAGKEYQTRQLVCDRLDSLGIPHIDVTETALIGIWDTGKPGKRVALRADMDALPMVENPQNLKGDRTCMSSQADTCHACGHDAHTAMLLASITLLHSLKSSLCGIFYFCFEAGEECGKSVNQMIEKLQRLKPDTVWAMHVYAGLASGKISVDAGPRMAGGAILNIQVNGQGGHASRPDKSRNPVYTAADIVTNIPGALLAQMNPEDAVTYGVTGIAGGGVGNIIPDTATIIGTMRFFNQQAGQKAAKIVREVAEYTAKMHHCTVNLPETEIFGGPVINDVVCAALADDILSKYLPADTICKCPPWYASESFARYLQEFPGVFAFLGIQNADYGSGAEHHNEYFDVDENVLQLGVAATALYAVSYMEKGGETS
ncbi:amidohydrolase [Scatolibacter rhodanostii]|uniref:amidohydrolase n=1 Tax=Scatolibacter rhodanostii TaxID=2014781 RepID=UPI000C07548B|nr:amidohydrolase [Scatolibacter rhodanostii]